MWTIRLFQVIHKKLYQPNVSCAEPERLRGKQWSEIKSEEFICKPIIRYPPQDDRLEFTDRAPWTIGCKVYGDPIPKAQWSLNNFSVSNDSLGDYILNESTVVNNTRWVNITWSKSQRKEPSEFKCIAINVGGSEERKITVFENLSRIDDPHIPINVDSDHLLIISIVVVSSVVVVVMLIVFYMFYCRQRLQQPLSDTELANLNRYLLKIAKKNRVMTSGWYNIHS